MIIMLENLFIYVTDVAFIYLYKYFDVLYIILDIYHMYMCNIYFIYM